MKKTLLITILTLAAVALGAAGLLAALGAFGGSIDDPAVAPCLRPPTTVGASRVVLDHREALVRFTCNEAQLVGHALPPAPARPTSRRRLGARQRRAAAALLRAAGGVVRRRRDRVLLLRQARRRRVGGRLLPRRARPLQPRHRRCGRRDRGRPLLLSRGRRPGGLRRRERSRLDRPACGRGIDARRVHRARQPRRAPAQPRRALRARGSTAAGAPARSSSGSPPGSRPASTPPRSSSASTSPRSGSSAAPTATSRRSTASRGSGRSNSDNSKDWTIIVYPGAGHGLFDDPPTDPRAAPTAEAWVRDHTARRESQDVTARPNQTRPQRP